MVNVLSGGALVQNGIDVAAVGGTVEVSAGTYTEDLVISKDGLELAGADSATTTIKGVAMTAAGLWPLAAANIEIAGDGVEIHDFTIASPDAVSGFYSSGVVVDAPNVHVHDNLFSTASAGSLDDISQAIQNHIDSDASGLRIIGNQFASFGAGAAGYEGIYINAQGSGAGGVTVEGNTLGGALIRGITTERGAVAIDNNQITTTLTPMGAGLAVGDSLQAINISGAPVGVSVTNNTAHGFSDDVRVGSASGGPVDALVLTGNTLDSIRLRNTITNGTLADAVATVRVDNDAASIQQGIDLAAVGGTVEVSAGTYTEDLVISKDGLELAGADSATTTIKGV
ncbi:MAG: hypothetical protein HON70_15445, partial [Lentisphaerae bacterium]|nr:hypothetical protein [Lentisphaerota bacterium]